MDCPLLFVDQENCEPGDENIEVVEMLLSLLITTTSSFTFILLDLKENAKLRRMLTKKVSMPTYR